MPFDRAGMSRGGCTDKMKPAGAEIADAVWINPRSGPEKVQLAFNSRSHLAKLVAVVVAMWPGPVDPIVSEAWDDVPVAMVDRLTGRAAVVDDHVECVGAGCRSNR